jgi:hypothetical protein
LVFYGPLCSLAGTVVSVSFTYVSVFVRLCVRVAYLRNTDMYCQKKTHTMLMRRVCYPLLKLNFARAIFCSSLLASYLLRAIQCVI